MTRRASTILGFVPLLLASACSGEIADGMSGDATDPTNTTSPGAPAVVVDDLAGQACDPALRGAGDTALLRLTKPQLVESLRSLFSDAVVDSPTVQSALRQVPAENASPSVEFDNRVTNVQGLWATAEAVAQEVFSDAAAIGNVLPGCNGSDVAACTTALVDGFAPRAYRRQLEEAQKQSITGLIAAIGGQEGLKKGLVRILISPYFQQHVELGDESEGVTPPRFRLSQYEVAARLAYRLAGTLPDAELWQAAQGGQLADVDSLRSHADRLINTAGARRHWRKLVTSWLGVRNIADPDPIISEQHGIVADGFGLQAENELRDFAEYAVFDAGGSWTTLLTDPTAFATSEDLAKVYGVTQATTPQPLSDGRGGLILRPALLMSHSKVTSPILRGAYIRKKVLCDTLPDPDTNAVAARLEEVEELSRDTLSNRQLAAETTSPAQCAACHHLLNPLGYTLEGFDPMGVPRQQEVVYDDNGPTATTHAIDTVVEDLFLEEEQVSPASGAADMIQQIAASSKAQQCFTESLITNTHLRDVTTGDVCTFNEMLAQLSSGAPLRDVLLQNTVNEDIFYKAEVTP